MMRPGIRRVVTANRPDGRSYIAEDRDVPHVRTSQARQGYRVNEVWLTDQSPVDINQTDKSLSVTELQPPAGGTLIRVIDYPAELPDPAAQAEAVAQSFHELYPEYANAHYEAHKPGKHKTLTVDYAIVLLGEMTAVLDEEETTLRAGDILIQRGTNHAWRNRSGAVVRMLYVLLDGMVGGKLLHE